MGGTEISPASSSKPQHICSQHANASSHQLTHFSSLEVTEYQHLIPTTTI